MSEKVKTKEISWLAVVNSAEPDRNRKRTVYVFSNGRKFKERNK